MKKITQKFRSFVTLFAIGSFYTRLCALCFGLALSSSFLFSAEQYCHRVITASDGVTSVYLTCKVVSTGNYQIKIESDVAMSGLGGSFCTVNGVGGYQLNASGHFTLSADGKTITCNIASTSGPDLYTPLYVLISGEKSFAWPAGIDWTATCPEVADTQAPTAFTATKGAVTSTSVELLLNATDNSGSVVYSISYGSGPTVLTTSGTSAKQVSYVVTGLTPATAYSFAVTAKDGSGNVASNSPVTVTATTVSEPAPAVSATTPPAYAASKVISIFSDAYTNVAGTDFNPNWGQATVESVYKLGSDNMLKYANLNYQGIAFGSHVFPLSMKYLHLDVWTANETSLQVFPICWNGTGNEAEKYKTLTPITLNQWNSFDIPITDFTSQGLTMSDVYQIKVVGTGSKTVYIDNIYFYDNSTTADTQAPTAFTATKGTVASDAVELLMNATDNSGAVSYSISYGSGPTVVNTSGTSGVQKSYTITGLTAATAYQFSVTAKDAAGNVAANSPIVLSVTTLAELPAAPTPKVDASKVISIFSDAYTNVAGTNFYPGWGQTTAASATTLSGNAVMKYANFNYMGIELASHIDVSKMTKLHVDILPTTETSVRLTPISPGHELPTSLGTLVANQWNSFDIPLNTYTGVVLTDIYQFKLDGGTGKTFYMDNLYFYDDTNTGLNDPEVTSVQCFPNPVKDMLTVSAKSGITKVELINIFGQRVKSVLFNDQVNQLNVSDVSNGTYFVIITLNNGQKATQKIVKL